MLARQARRTVSIHQVTARTPIGLSSKSVLRSGAISIVGQRSVGSQPRPWRRRGSGSGHSLVQGRSLATAVDDFQFGQSSYGHLNSGLPPFQPPNSQFYDLRSLDTSPLTIPEPAAPLAQPAKYNAQGVPGDIEDMLPVFDACIRVGKLERASLVLKRINATGAASPEEQIILHNKYLRASLNQMRMSPDRKQAEQLHKWYELQIRNKGIPQTAETIACMLKASLLSERGVRLQRLINRYMNMAPGEAGLRVLSMADVLSDQDLAVITGICPTYNFVPDVEEPEVALQNQQTALSEGTEQAESQLSMFPDVVETPQRGEGLNTLKRSLALMRELQDVDVSQLPEEEQFELQARLERDSIEAAVARWRADNEHLQKMGVNTALSANSEDGSLSQNIHGWMTSLEARIRQEFVNIETSEAKGSKTEEDLERCIYGPFLRQGDSTRLAAVTILTVLNSGAIMGASSGIVISKLVMDIAKVVQEDIRVHVKEQAQKMAKRHKVKFVGDAEKTTNHDGPIIMDATQPMAETAKDSKHEEIVPWSTTIKGHVGAILLKSLVETAKVKVVKTHPVTKQLTSQNQPAFTHMLQNRKGKKTGMLILNSELVSRMMKEPVGDFIAKHLPMIARPKPWRRMHEGGFLESKTTLVRTRPGAVEQKLYATAALQRGDMKQVTQGLDVLAKTPWRINNNVLGVMLEAWNSGEAIANMPPLNPDLELPPEPVSVDDPMLRRAWLRDVKLIENERCALHSQRCFMNLQLEIARAYRNQVIYFPHNLDYRGRAYPIPTYLNHMGADHNRALLKFAEGRELGVSGLRWLKIHLSNLYGYDKASFDEREAFADDNAANIIESATNPLNGSRWWLKAEDPWQCLAACFELKAALELPDPTKFVSQLPVHQDGTCNGLQHYAALGGDTWGAKQVNLEPGSRPADVYNAVADLVKQSIAKDVAANNRFALAVDGKITRKVVKQTVMTNVYGVTFAGAKKQVCKQLDAIYPDLPKECGIPNMLLATYIAKHTFEALATMFRGAHDIQYWLGEVGGRVCRALTPAQLKHIAEEFDNGEATTKGKKKRQPKSVGDELIQQCRSTIVWTTPLRMPVVQPYRKSTMKEVHTCLQSISFPTSNQTDPVNKRKQLQGFPPNFIHSLDASHMLLSALECDSRGLNFAAVHDSFWTHAADVDIMNTVIRDSFIRIHEEDVVGRLLAEFETRYKGSLYEVKIDRSSAVGKKILALRKSSKLSAKEELLLEYKRQGLLLSGNPWDLETAKQIVTPASVYEDMVAAEEAVIEEAAEHVKLGEVPEEEANLDEAAIAKEAEAMEDLADAEAEVEAREDSLEDSHDMMDDLLENSGKSHFKMKVIDAKPAPKKGKSQKIPLSIWLPMTFPTIPKKGDFDVSRLKESKYFFS